MDRPFYTILISLLLMMGCAPRMPVSSNPAIINTKPLPKTVIPLPSKDLAVVTIPFKRPTQIDSQSLIILDPGHGGEDFGTQSLVKPKYKEKYLNMSTAQLVKNYLQQFGYKIIMTRDNDTFVSLEQRALFANERKPILFVSIHYNSAPSKEAEGVEVFYYSKDEDKMRVAKSKYLAQSVLDKVIKNTKAKSRGIKHGNYAVIRETKMPAILIEGGFLSNESEMEKLKDGAYIKSIALGIAQGVQNYLAKQSLLAEK